MTNSSGTEAVTVAEKPSLFKNKKLVSIFSNFIFPLVLAIVILFSSGYAKNQFSHAYSIITHRKYDIANKHAHK